MPRKQSAIVQYKLRIRETLRRRIEQEAKKHGVSANQEMVSRLERSFEAERIRTLDEWAEDFTHAIRRLRDETRELAAGTQAAIRAIRDGAKNRAGDDQ